ncbi:MAG: Coenzyme F420 hydrogenase/dehydrogenase, beta subunit C-terminal domain [Clostridiales bacterium]|nr:Coenzyme F420 hydrogenase/dehydrogenase, beta subunit C-terminal domain [Clostridiales bacterium]
MSVSKDKYNCCGCSACEAVCGHHAIEMRPDSVGFLYPEVDASKCIECGLCERVCNFTTKYPRYENFDKPLTYLTRLKDVSELKKSQSGGAFYAIASCFIENGGIVYGASFDNNWVVRHNKAESISELQNLRMSKYVQSEIRTCYKEVRQLLIEGYKVLFSGTPCQISAIKSYIPNLLHANLYCIDIVCHAVPSPKIWSEYISYLENKNKSKIIKACFRDKRFGWHGARESFLFENGHEEFRRTNNILYFSKLSVRESCSNCPFTNTSRIGDITVGDFWGLPKDSKFEDNLGTSLVYVNSDKGVKLLETIKDSVIVEPKTLNESIQPQLISPIKLNNKRKQFLHDYISGGFIKVAKKYSDVGYRYKVNRTISLLKNLIKTAIRR